jgi:sortase A
VRRALRIFSVSLITAGLVILADVALTLAWEEPVSSIYGGIEQRKAEDDLAQLRKSLPTAEDLAALEDVHGVRAKSKVLAGRFARAAETGTGIGEIEIPSIGVDIVLVQGTDSTSLRSGPGHYPDTSFPGQNRTVAVAGHRTTYLAPFHDIDGIEPGDDVVVEMPYATFTYEVNSTDIVGPSEVSIVDDVGYERLVLTACHPLYSAAQRYAIFARLDSVSFFAGSDRRWQDP